MHKLRFLVFSLALAACDTEPAATTPAHEATPPAAPTDGAHGNTLTGKVAETMDAGGYTYMNLMWKEGFSWVAVPATTVAVGDTVTIENPMVMTNFESPTLGRKFDTILFAQIASGAGGSPNDAAGAAPTMSPHGKDMAAAAQDPSVLSAHSAASGAGPSVTDDIDKAPGGYTVSELYAQKGTLAEQQVTVRGKVVKYNASILGRNWAHIQDGSGSAGANDFDITVTTTETMEVGTMVTVKGTLRTDKDFGGGYSYAVIIEDAGLVN